MSSFVSLFPATTLLVAIGFVPWCRPVSLVLFSVGVVVTNKREKPLNDRRSRQQQVTPAGTTMRYEASFKPETGGLEMTFRLEAQQYHQLTVGEKGTLSYKGSRFEGFEPEL